MTDRLEQIKAKHWHPAENPAADCSGCWLIRELEIERETTIAVNESNEYQIGELRKELEQAAAREAVLRTEVTRMNHSYVQMGCMKKPEYCAPCRVLANTSEAARELLEKARKWDKGCSCHHCASTDRERDALLIERDTLKRQRTLLRNALEICKGSLESVILSEFETHKDHFPHKKNKGWKVAAEALRAVEQDDA